MCGIERPGQVWQTDITYIPMLRGFMYMNAIIDVYSRKILNWSISNSLDNILIKRFWKSIKYERIYLNPPNGGLDLYEMVSEYIEFYNTRRRHTEIGKVPPDQLYGTKKIAS